LTSDAPALPAHPHRLRVKALPPPPRHQRHAQAAVMLRRALINRPGMVITSVPCQMAPETGGIDAAPGEDE
jgi:hypothetical protein